MRAIVVLFAFVFGAPMLSPSSARADSTRQTIVKSGNRTIVITKWCSTVQGGSLPDAIRSSPNPFARDRLVGR